MRERLVRKTPEDWNIRHRDEVETFDHSLTYSVTLRERKIVAPCGKNMSEPKGDDDCVGQNLNGRGRVGKGRGIGKSARRWQGPSDLGWGGDLERERMGSGRGL